VTRALFGLIGDPVAHSRSPAIHARAFELLGVDAEYRALRVPAAEVPDTIAKLYAIRCRGFNVTVPHKEAVAPLCATLSQAAAQIGAVNCVALDERDEYTGHNTDAPGLLRALRAHGIGPAGARAVVVGAGGSARAVAWALVPHAAQITILNRTASKARALASLIQAAGGRAEVATLDSKQAFAEATLVIHCTTIGLNTNEIPFDPSLLRRDCTLVDLVYTPGGQTELLKRFAGRNVDGIEVLVHQAIASLEIWLSRPQLDELAGPLREAALS
jgi:shikimate dehydrogenase